MGWPHPNYNFTTKSYLDKKRQTNVGRGKVLLPAGREFSEAAAALFRDSVFVTGFEVILTSY